MCASFVEKAKSYASYHQHPHTKITHYVGVPLIVFSIMIFLGFFRLSMIGVFSVSLACLGTIALLAYYLKLEWRLALSLTPVLLLFLWLAHLISANGPTTGSFWTFIIFFVGGWAAQLVGHFVFEKNRPALMDNIWQVLIAPLFLVAEAYFYFGKMFKLQSEIYGNAVASQQTEDKADTVQDKKAASNDDDSHEEKQ